MYAKVPVMQKAILQLKATLIATDPPVWRRILVPAEYSFANLHAALQDAFGWTDSHLHHFLTANPFKRNAAYKRISLPMPDIDLPDEEPSLDELKEKISEWLVKPEDTVYYEYDFGDSWMHEIKLEKISCLSGYYPHPQHVGCCPATGQVVAEAARPTCRVFGWTPDRQTKTIRSAACASAP